MYAIFSLYPIIWLLIWAFNLFRSILVFLFINMPILGPSIEHVVSPPEELSTLSSEVEKYDPKKDTPPTQFAIKCHPRAAQVTAELDAFFIKYWPFKDEKARESFKAGQYNLWACMALPSAHDDRVHDACKVNTLLFLLDGMTSPTLQP